MQTTKTKKLSTIAALGAITMSTLMWIAPANYFQEMMENDMIRSLKKKLTEYNEHLPEDRVYLQLDKPFYEPGDDIWFSAYVRDGLSMKPSSKSDIVHVELISPKGTVEKKINIIARNGKAAGDFSIDKEALGGMYKIRAYTNWQKNQSDDHSFVKDIQVQEVILPNLKMKLDFEKKAFGAGDEVIAKLELNTNENKPLSNYKIKFVANLKGEKIVDKADITDEDGIRYIKFNLPKALGSNDGLLNVMIDYNGSTESVSRSIPIILNTVKFSMFPEGGDLVSGLDNTVAFCALNEFDKPADVEGVVLTDKGSRVAAFSSFHQGMGAFKFNPQPGEKYVVKITKPEGIKQTFSLPEPLQRGYNLNVDNSKAGEVAVNINTTETEELALVAQVRGKIYYSTLVAAKPGSNKLIFTTRDFPIGVSQLTLFDSKGIARAERLAFVNKDKQLNISVETDKDKYLPREKVKMTLVVKDERGLPMPANLSLSVVNDQLLSFADDKSGNILSQLLLQQDLKQKVEEPAFYFSKKEAKADKALDYLLMTAGWRRFTWEKVLEEELPAINFAGEKAIVAGTVMNAETGKPMNNVRVKIPGGAEYNTDSEGKFSLKKLDLSAPVSLMFNSDGFYQQSQYIQDYNQNMILYMYKQNYNYYSYGKGSHRANKSAGAGGMMIEDAIPAAPNMGAGMVVEKAPVNKPMPMGGMAQKKLRDHSGADGKKEAPKRIANENVENLNIAKQEPLREQKDRVQDLKVLASVAADRRAEKFKGDDMDELEIADQPAVNVYYRARQYYAPAYDKQQNVEERTDFRNTIYWNPNVEVGYNGRKTIEFFASDDITSFRTTVEGIGSDGSIGRMEKNFFSQLPFAMTTKIPVEVATEDFVSIPLTLKNNTDGPLGGVITISAPDGLKELAAIPTVQTIMPGAAKTIYLDYKVLDKIGYGEFTISFKACGLGDAFTQKIKIAPKGFPVQASFSAQEVEKEYSFAITKMVNGSLKANFTAFPNVVSDLMKGVEGILQEPYGCFEQTSCTAYPNAMVLDYLKNTDSKDNKTLARATDLLDRGYKRLTTFETTEKGYEWFGANPGHEGLTAYGIMEFVDMKKAGQDVDQKMLDRTAQWLMKHKDGKGGFAREKHAYHDFGRISDDILNAYIVYALAEAGYTDIQNEFETSYKKAMDTKDPYMLAMMANAAYSMKDNSKGDAAMTALVAKQGKDGSFTGSSHSITYSQGESLTIETTALSIMATLKSGKNANVLSSAVQFLVSTRSGSGIFSSTQGTILALKALTEYAKFSKKTTEDGTIAIYVDGKKVAERSYKAGDKGAIAVDGLEDFIKGEGTHSVKVKYIGVKTPLPYSLAINWSTSLPNSDKECNIDLKTKMASNTANVGETVRMTTTISNKKNEEVPSTMAIIGIPAGFSVQPWQLKELQEKKVFDYYEIKGNNIAVYYRGMAPKAVKEIRLDLKAELPGEYDAPASSAYLYYTNEFKTWSATDRITIKKTNS